MRHFGPHVYRAWQWVRLRTAILAIVPAPAETKLVDLAKELDGNLHQAVEVIALVALADAFTDEEYWCGRGVEFEGDDSLAVVVDLVQTQPHLDLLIRPLDGPHLDPIRPLDGQVI